MSYSRHPLPDRILPPAPDGWRYGCSHGVWYCRSWLDAGSDNPAWRDGYGWRILARVIRQRTRPPSAR